MSCRNVLFEVGTVVSFLVCSPAACLGACFASVPSWHIMPVAEANVPIFESFVGVRFISLLLLARLVLPPTSCYWWNISSASRGRYAACSRHTTLWGLRCVRWISASAASSPSSTASAPAASSTTLILSTSPPVGGRGWGINCRWGRIVLWGCSSGRVLCGRHYKPLNALGCVHGWHSLRQRCQLLLGSQ